MFINKFNKSDTNKKHKEIYMNNEEAKTLSCIVQKFRGFGKNFVLTEFKSNAIYDSRKYPNLYLKNEIVSNGFYGNSPK